MAFSHLCPRCARWHDAAAPCDLATALRTFLAGSVAQQRQADQFETIAVARYRLQRRLRG